MKRNLLYCLSAIFISMNLVSCDLEEIPPYEELTASKEGVQIFIPKINNGIHFLETFSLETEEPTETDSINFNVGFGALGLPANNIQVSLAKDTQVIDSINAAREINGEPLFLPFPEDAFTIDNLTLTIPRGEEYSNLTTFTYYPEKFSIDENYLLAFSIEDASGYAVNKAKGTMVFAVSEVIIPEPEPQFFEKEEWAVLEYSSQQPGGEAALIIDGDDDTFWHSCYSNCPVTNTNGYPHFLTLDMGSQMEVDGFRFHQRIGTTSTLRHFKDFEILVSDDNVEWTSLGDFQLFDHIAPQLVPLPERQEFRYFKILLKSSFDGERFATLAEVSAYILE